MCNGLLIYLVFPVTFLYTCAVSFLNVGNKNVQNTLRWLFTSALSTSTNVSIAVLQTLTDASWDELFYLRTILHHDEWLIQFMPGYISRRIKWHDISVIQMWSTLIFFTLSIKTPSICFCSKCGLPVAFFTTLKARFFKVSVECTALLSSQHILQENVHYKRLWFILFAGSKVGT